MRKKSEKNKIIVLIVLIILLIGLIIIYRPKQNKSSYIDNLENDIQIEVITNDDGIQESAGIDKGTRIDEIFGAATVNELSGGEKQNDSKSIEDILQNEEIEI